MPHRAIRTAIAAALAATALTAPANAPEPADVQPAAAEVAHAGVPAVTLLSGAGPASITSGDRPAAAAALGTTTCRGNPIADGTPPQPCPPPADWTSSSTFAIVKQPHPSVDQHATPAGGPSTPALLLLDQIRPRSALPAGRTTRLDPRPA